MTRLFYEKHVPAGSAARAAVRRPCRPTTPSGWRNWLGEVFGGPKAYSQEYGGYSRMISQHLGKGLTEEQRARWVALLLQSAREAGLPNDAEFRSAFGSYIEWGSRLAVENSQTGRPAAPAHADAALGLAHRRRAARFPDIRAGSAAAERRRRRSCPPPVSRSASSGTSSRCSGRDRQSMSFAFDLWSYEDVREHADAILDRIRAGTMPCDGAWPPARVDALQRWADTGQAP